MRVGLMADTHDNLNAIRYLVAYFHQERVETVVHAGDFVSPFTIPELDRFEGRVLGVFGNNDGDRDTLLAKAEGSSVEIHRPPHRAELGTSRFLISHRPDDLPPSIPDDIDFVLHGHTHERRIDRHEKHVLINPGEAGGWLTGVCHGMVLNTETDELESHVVPSP